MTDRRQVVYLREADAFIAQAGGVEFTKQGGVPIHAGTWFDVDRHTVRLRPHENVGAGNFGFRLLSRLAIAVQFTLPGERVTALDVKDTDIAISPGGASSRPRPSSARSSRGPRSATRSPGRARRSRAPTTSRASGTAGWIYALLGAALMAVIGLLVLLSRSRRRDEDPPLPRDFAPAVELARVPAAVGAPGAGMVDVNSASAEELAQVAGIGRLAAERIVAHRNECGRFASVADPRAVDGFDEQRARRLEEHLST